MSSPFAFMTDGRRVARIAGIDVTISSSFIPLATILIFSLTALAGGIMPALAMVVLLAASIVAHEFGHALTARAFGIRTHSITLHLLGGVAKIEGEAQRPTHEILIAAAGPAVSLALAGLFFGLSAMVGAMALPGTTVLVYLTLANLTLALFNLLPGLPLDGGRILRGVLWARSGDRRTATIAAARGGEFLAYGVFGLAVLNLADPNGGFFRALLTAAMGWFLWSAARAEKQRAEAEGQPRGRRILGLQDLLRAFAAAQTRAHQSRSAPERSSPSSASPWRAPSGGPADDAEIIRFPDGRELYTGRKGRSH